MGTEIEKVLMCGDKGGNEALTAAMLNGQQNWMNNPFVYLVWMMFANRFMGGNAENSQELASLRSQMADNQNSNLLMDAIRGNASSITTLASNLNCDFNSLNSAICSVKSAVESVGGSVGFSAERVINAVLSGNKDVAAAIQNCCCENKTLQMQNFAALQLQSCQDKGSILSRIDQLANGTQTGFAQVGYATQQQTCDIITNANNNTQRIIDALNQHWNAELQQKYADAQLELSQQRQTSFLISQLKTTSTTTA